MIGSSALLCMVMAHLQLHDTKATASAAARAGAKPREEGCLGALLIDFFELYAVMADTGGRWAQPPLGGGR